MRKILAALLFALTSTMALAMPRPAEIAGEIKASKPHGEGSLTWLFLTAYEAGLWTDAREWSMKERFALTLVYHMSFSAEELAERTLKEMKALSPGLSKKTQQRHAMMLQRAFPAVKAGDRITALHTPGQPLRFFHNGRLTATSQDNTFADPFFAIWFSPETSEPRLRRALLRLTGS